MKNFVVYTVLVGDYDEILQPSIVDERFDYVLFSNDIKEEYIGVWEVKSIPLVVKNDNKRLSRYPKTHPETMLSEYKASLYHDANIQIQDHWVYDRCVELYEQRNEYAGIKLVMTGRDCIYEHAFEMCQWYVVHDYDAIKQCHQLYKLGFPQHFGLNENNIIFRIHTERMKTTDELWWDWIVNYSFRDQFSYMYCLWANKIEINYFLPVGEDARNGNHFRLIQHTPSGNKQKAIKIGIIERLRIKSKSFDMDENSLRWMKIVKCSFPIVYLYIDGACTIIRNVPNMILEVINKKRAKC